MKLQIMFGSALLLGLILAPVAHANPPTDVELEANFLLGYVQESGCLFYRNGMWFEAKTAQTHLRDKYNYLASRNAINSAEDFIARAASVSSFSGQPYQVRCGDRATVSSSQWLGEELARLRTTQ